MPLIYIRCRYERKPPCSFKNIVDTQIVSAMGPPGGGRNPVSARVLRHFNILSFTELSDDSVGCIFKTILGAFLQRNFGAEIGELTDKVCNHLVHSHADRQPQENAIWPSMDGYGRQSPCRQV